MIGKSHFSSSEEFDEYVSADEESDHINVSVGKVSKHSQFLATIANIFRSFLPRIVISGNDENDVSLMSKNESKTSIMNVSVSDKVLEKCSLSSHTATSDSESEANPKTEDSKNKNPKTEDSKDKDHCVVKLGNLQTEDDLRNVQVMANRNFHRAVRKRKKLARKRSLQFAECMSLSKSRIKLADGLKKKGNKILKEAEKIKNKYGFERNDEIESLLILASRNYREAIRCFDNMDIFGKAASKHRSKTHSFTRTLGEVSSNDKNIIRMQSSRNGRDGQDVIQKVRDLLVSLHLNLAHCMLHLNDAEKTTSNCDFCLELLDVFEPYPTEDNCNMSKKRRKVHFRLALALEKLGDHIGAIQQILYICGLLEYNQKSPLGIDDLVRICHTGKENMRQIFSRHGKIRELFHRCKTIIDKNIETEKKIARSMFVPAKTST